MATAVAGVSKAKAQLKASAAEVNRREMDPVVADVEIARLEAQFQRADDILKRLEPLLPRQFVYRGPCGGSPHPAGRGP